MCELHTSILTLSDSPLLVTFNTTEVKYLDSVPKSTLGYDSLGDMSRNMAYDTCWYIESLKLLPIIKITQEMTKITNKRVKITLVYVHLYVIWSHIKFHEDWTIVTI